ncbi:GNAT family N-acetyltransferase [Salirhabdus salicampi]|uniref:GNAT family N-acetyltransferase n=1 Tax=Salirhabdus salicampi TaxID=476102 RepID=UPI0020C2FC48|nr:GNAT family N-acetyltransferase [Salirhabdus salicampi]MCP8618127.1 GNAT family N-acetyltransferase [Salirhabdus salicampi]
MQWMKKSFQQLSNNELYAILKERVDVFVVEQECPYPEIDNVDQDAIHYYLQIGERIAAYCRLIPSGTKFEEASVGRVIVNRDFRGNGYARTMLKNAILILLKDWGETSIKIQAQLYLEEFYQSVGFQTVSEPYMYDGILHIDMILHKEDILS